MIQALLKAQDGCYFVYEISDVDGKKYIGGLTLEGRIFTDPGCPHKQMLFRAVINKCTNGLAQTLYTDGDWGFDLCPFGFEKTEQGYKAVRESLKLPRCQGCH